MDAHSLKLIIMSPLGVFAVLAIKMLVGAIFLCLGIQMFDFKKFSSAYSWRSFVSLFLIIFGVRFFLSVVFNEAYSFEPPFHWF